MLQFELLKTLTNSLIKILKCILQKAPEETEESAGNTESEESAGNTESEESAGNAESEESVTKETEEQTEGESETVEEKIAKFKLDQQLDGEDDDEDGDDDDDDIENDPDLKSSGDDHPDITKTHTSKTGTMIALKYAKKTEKLHSSTFIQTLPKLF